MTDNTKGLLTRAAKNAGYDITFTKHGHAYWRHVGGLWQPHLDDGDSFRLADVMGMVVDCRKGTVFKYRSSHEGACTYLAETFTPHNPEERRMAVLRSAAESTKGE